jgi:transcription elongation factor GreA
MEQLEQAEILLTQEGYELKQKQLEEYRRILHEEIPKRLKMAKEHGGELKENKEYLDILSEKEYYEAEVRRLEDLLERAKIIDEESISTKKVGIGTRVILRNLDAGEQLSFDLVSPAEVDLEANKISSESPLGRALMGHRRGEDIEIEVPTGTIRYKIIGIQRG